MPGQLTQLIAWWNLPFTLPFGLALLYLVLTASGVVDAAGAGDDAETGAGPDADADAPDHPLSPDRADAPEPSGAASRVLGLLGVGRVPLAIVIQVFFLVWGFSGWAANTLLQPLLREPLLFFWPTLLIAAIAAVLATVGLARPLARWLPSTESHAATKRDLAGRVGTVVFPVGPSGGTVHVRDDRGNLHQIACHLDTLGVNGSSGAESRTIPKGAEVIVVSYDESTGHYLVIPSDLPALPTR